MNPFKRKLSLTLFVFTLFTLTLAQAQEYKQSITEFQEHLNEEYQNPETSPLSPGKLKAFEGHDFFPADETYRVEARFERAENAVPFLMPTTSDRLPTYEIFGVATFEINNTTYQLNIYQSHDLRKTEEYKNHLFLPFTDMTNGKDTYGGGRFIDLEIPAGGTIVIDFNKAYNPYCAYSSNYSCPIPPKENDLPVRIEAGVKLSK